MNDDQQDSAQPEPVAWIVYALHYGEATPQYPPYATKEQAEAHARMFVAAVKVEVRPLYTTPAPAVAPAAVTDETAWQQAERITDVPAVEDALRTFLADQTGDNATGVVCAVLTASCRQPCNAAGCLARTPEPQAELADFHANVLGEPQPDSRGREERACALGYMAGFDDGRHGRQHSPGLENIRRILAASPTPDEQRAQAAQEGTPWGRIVTGLVLELDRLTDKRIDEIHREVYARLVEKHKDKLNWLDDVQSELPLEFARAVERELRTALAGRQQP